MRSKFSQAIHTSIQKQLRQYEETGKIGKQRPPNKDAAVLLAAQLAYNRVRTNPGKGDIGPRKV